MQSFHKHSFSFYAFFLTVFIVLFLGLVFSPEALAQQQGKGKKTPRAAAPLAKTGQTISYGPGDDGDLQVGVAWPVPRFIDNGDGTVTDKLTGLMWTQNSQQIPGRKHWDQALSDCSNYVFAGYSDWRVPNLLELRSLVDYGVSSIPVLPVGSPFLFDINTDYYWTSTTMACMLDYLWTISMQIGREFPGYKLTEDPNTGLSVWPVRGPVSPGK